MNKELFRDYISKVRTFLEKNYSNHLVSIVLFGSTVSNDKTGSPSTDVDLMVILKDECPKNVLKEIRQNLFLFEKRFITFNQELISPFFKGLQTATGMFVNFFICKYSDFKGRSFKVFSINPIMGVLAPKNSVWWSIFRQHEIIWGQDVFLEWDSMPQMTKVDVIQSLIMNWLLSLSSLLFYPFYPKIAKFSMESIKWSLFTWRNYKNLPIYSPNQITRYYSSQASVFEQRVLGEFVKYRVQKQISRFFPLMALFFVLSVHFNLLNQ